MTVIPFPSPERSDGPNESAPSCDRCVNAATGTYGLYCTEFHEWVLDVLGAAADCGLYQT